MKKFSRDEDVQPDVTKRFSQHHTLTAVSRQQHTLAIVSRRAAMSGASSDFTFPYAIRTYPRSRESRDKDVPPDVMPGLSSDEDVPPDVIKGCGQQDVAPRPERPQA